jgi:PDZ domain-containing secreted protein
MDQSQNDAKYVALTRLGYTVHVDPAQIRVVEVCQGAPAYGEVEPGDRVLAVDDQDITDVGQIAPIVQSHRPGDEVHVTVDRNGTTRTATVVAGKVSKDRRVNAGSTSGPHLPGIRQELRPIDLDQRQDQHRSSVAVGGTRLHPIIDDLTPGASPAEAGGGDRHHQADGSVGEVGGVERRRSPRDGAQPMIVPSGGGRQARRTGCVVGVTNVDGPGRAQRNGGAEVPTVDRGAT